MTRPDMGVIREQLEALGQRLRTTIGPQLSNRIDLTTTANTVKKYAYDHPMLSLVLVIAAMMCSIPLITFICFVIATLSFTFMGFIFVEGTLLTVGTFLLSGVLFVIALFALGFSAFVAGTWLFFSKAIGMVNKASQKFAPKPLLPSPPQERSLQHVD